MGATLEQQNIIRQRAGLEPLDKLPESNEVAKVEDTTTTKTDIVNIATEEVKEEIKSTETEKEVNKKEEDKTIISKKLSKEELLAALKEQGIEINSLDDFKKKETPEDIAQKRESAKLAYALEKQLVTPKEYQSFSADSSNLSNLVYRQYLQQQQKEDPALTDAEILEEFEEKYGLKSEQDSRKYKRGQLELQVIGNQILKETYKGIYSIDPEFDKFEATENSRKAEEKKLFEETPKYKAHIEDIFSKDFKKYSVKIDKENFDIEIPENILSTLKNEFLNTESAISNIKSGYDNDTIKRIAHTRLMMDAFDTIIANAAKQYAEKHEKGTKGVPTDVTTTKTEEKPLTDAQKKARQIVFGDYQTVAN